MANTNVNNQPTGYNILLRISKEVEERSRVDSVNYNERYIDGGPSWGEHINYSDGGQHGQTHRPSIKMTYYSESGGTDDGSSYSESI